jgi:ectoine hydroxylase-related dioxygenase (phytanoyl-CoA dioxygenase family)
VQTLNDLGFQVIPNVFSSSDCKSLLSELEALIAQRSRAGARHLIAIPAVAALANEHRLRSIASAVLGPHATAYRATLFDKSAESNWSVVWHQDTALPLRTRFESDGWGPWSVKAGIKYAHAPTAALRRILALRIHLDDSTETNGPLRVIPGSHQLGVLSDDEVSRVAHASTSVACVVARGGVLAMRPLAIHSSSRITTPAPRRVLHLEYAEQLEILPGIELATA